MLEVLLIPSSAHGAWDLGGLEQSFSLQHWPVGHHRARKGSPPHHRRKYTRCRWHAVWSIRQRWVTCRVPFGMLLACPWTITNKSADLNSFYTIGRFSSYKTNIIKLRLEVLICDRYAEHMQLSSKPAMFWTKMKRFNLLTPSDCQQPSPSVYSFWTDSAHSRAGQQRRLVGSAASSAWFSGSSPSSVGHVKYLRSISFVILSCIHFRKGLIPQLQSGCVRSVVLRRRCKAPVIPCCDHAPGSYRCNVSSPQKNIRNRQLKGRHTKRNTYNADYVE